MKKSELRQIIKEEISKTLKESNLSLEEDEMIEDFIRSLEQAIYSARQLQINGETENMDFGSLVDAVRDELRGFE